MPEQNPGTLGERDWTLLYEAIKDNRVIPILGEKVFFVKEDGNRIPIDEFIKGRLADKFCPGKGPEDMATIEEAIEDWNFINRHSCTPTNIYFEINQILRGATIKCDDEVIKMVKSCRFPIILCTTYVPNIESILNLDTDKILIYKKSAKPDIDLYEVNPSHPIVYYMFGKSASLSKTYMATEDDFLDYIHAWHNSETRPKTLSRYLSDKFILALGSEYPDWIFRFIWHSLKNFNISPSRMDDTQGIVTLDDCADETKLKRFINHVQAQAYHHSTEFVTELNRRWEEEEDLHSPDSGDAVCCQELDVFISYASEDFETANAIADIFREQGASVWLDKKKLEGGDEYDRIIKKAISRCKRFVPILSKATMKNERRYFRKEWSYAINETDYRLRMEYIIPIDMGEGAMSSDLIPETFKEKHCLSFNSPDFVNSVKTLVRKIRE